MKSYNIQFGTNATGKSTRLLNVILFLMSKYEHETIVETENGFTKELGIKFHDINILILGKFGKSRRTGERSWSSLDYLLGAYGGVAHLQEVLLRNCDDMHVVAEGYLLDSFKQRPEYMRETYNCQKYMSCTYYYETREQYDERIFERSGKPTKGKTGWGYNTRMGWGFFDKILSEKTDVDCAYKELYTAAPEYFGDKLFEFLCMNDLREEFLSLDHSIKSPTLNLDR